MARILVVDDEPQICKLLKQYILSAGYDCVTAQDVNAAKEVLKNSVFDLVLNDLTMPGESGVELIQHVNENHPDVAVIVLSAIDNPEEANQALELGVYGYIVKPVTRNIVLINVENALRRRRLEIERRAHLEKLESLVLRRTKTLNDQLAFMQTLIDAIPSPVFFKDREVKFQGCNTAFEVLAGKKRKAIIGRTADKAVPNLIADISHETDRILLREPGKVTYEYYVTYPDESRHNFLINKATFQDADGDLAGLVGVMADITERKAAEEAQRLSEEKFRRIVENIGIGVALISSDARILEMNRQMREWFPNVEPGEERPCYQQLRNSLQNKPCHGCPAMEAMATGKVYETTLNFIEDSGKRCFRIIASPIPDRTGKISAAIELVEDITQKDALERELRQAQKLESIGQLAAGIAHEINTPIQYVGDNARFLEDAFGDLGAVLKAYAKLLDVANKELGNHEIIKEVRSAVKAADISYLSEEIPSAIEQTLEGVQRVSKIIQAMRQFSHPGTGRKEQVDINQALESTITVARNEWKYVADLETDFAGDLPAVSCLPGEINQVFLNLLINAAHAIGELTNEGKSGKGIIRISTRSKNGSVQIRISDNGGGIPESIQTRIFDPFFTTKPVGKGTGQGLAIAHSVITEKHAGNIRFETGDGIGTAFIIELPRGTTGEKTASQGAQPRARGD